MWFVIIPLCILSFGIGLWKLFEKAGKPGWHAAVPVLNLMTWADIIGRPRISLLWYLVPVVNIFTFANMLIDLVNSFGKWGFFQQTLAVVTPWYYLPKLGFTASSDKSQTVAETPAVSAPAAASARAARSGKPAAATVATTESDTVDYQGPSLALTLEQRPAKSVVREWADAIVFAVFAAHFIRMFIFEAFTIPTQSMQSTMHIGDFLFVNKLAYGARTPMTPLSIPLVHNLTPVLGTESYSKFVKLPYNRLPALENLDRYDPVVFNYPEGDSVFSNVPFGPGQFHEQIRAQRGVMIEDVRNRLKQERKFVVRPIDKRDHYIKRCVGVPGDVIEIKDHILYVNGQVGQEMEKQQYDYYVFTKKQTAEFQQICDELDVEEELIEGVLPGTQTHLFQIPLFKEQKAKLKAIPGIDSIKMIPAIPAAMAAGRYFPYSPNYAWSNDNFGPLAIPKKGETVQLDMKNFALYRRIIGAYEGNKLEVKGNQIVINGQPANAYTFKQNYYWMMGDNRHHSADSRYFGFVPEDHIVGKPLIVFMSLRKGSLSNGIRWHQMFRVNFNK